MWEGMGPPGGHLQRHLHAVQSHSLCLVARDGLHAPLVPSPFDDGNVRSIIRTSDHFQKHRLRRHRCKACKVRLAFFLSLPVALLCC